MPRITDDFHSLNDVGWYGTSYLLVMCGMQLLMGKIYKHYPAKPVFLIGCVFFEIGSAICGAAPSSNTFIGGRAIAGLGSTAMLGGVVVILVYVVPPAQRPIYQGLFGCIFAIASVVGPLLGGVFVDRLSWRWCFYINLPVGAVSMVVTMFILKMPVQKLETPAKGWYGKIAQLDPLGTLVFLPGIVCLVLALQWGGVQYSWKNARIIVLFILAAVLIAVFVGIQAWKGEAATIPPRIVRNRDVIASSIFGFFNSTSLMVSMYYLPLWFQSVKGSSAIHSGIMLLPMILSTVVAMILSGILLTRVKYYAPFFWTSSALMSIGAGLLTTFTPSTGHSKWIGYQVIFGFGLGLGAQQPLTVVQSVLAKTDVAQGSSFVMFIRFMGSSIFVPVAQTVFINSLVSKSSNVPGIDPHTIANTGATDLINLASGDNLRTLLWDYNESLMNVFYMFTGICCASFIGSVMVRWRKLPTQEVEEGKDPEGIVVADA